MVSQRNGGIISQLDREGLGWQMGLRQGDVVLSVNGQPVQDVIDFRFHSAEQVLDLEVQRGESKLLMSADRDYGEPMGIQFSHPTFDVDIRRCVNRCPFCFVTQSPPKMRRTLYIKDDDYRYSFLFGHFVTLTNLEREDWDRIAAQRLSPLYVSVHATEPSLRAYLLGKSNPPDILEQLHWLQEHSIEVHTQLVLLPGVNDGQHLERSLEDLIAFYPSVQSVSVVPVGLTAYSPAELQPYSAKEAKQVLEQVEAWRQRCRAAWDTTMVYPSDEWYLLAQRSVPSTAYYDDFGQLENGVGMVRAFLADWARLKRRLRRRSTRGSVAESADDLSPRLVYRHGVLVCGRLAASVLEGFAAELNTLLGVELRVHVVDNEWYGKMTTVSGLLTGRDVVAQIDRDVETANLGELVLLPRVMFDNAGLVTLDDQTTEDIRRQLGRPVAVVQTPAEVVDALQGVGETDSTLTPKPGWWGEQNRPFWQIIEEYE
jgi:putative radical SAM enzyme (TIGR03279 family)